MSQCAILWLLFIVWTLCITSSCCYICVIAHGSHYTWFLVRVLKFKAFFLMRWKFTVGSLLALVTNYIETAIIEIIKLRLSGCSCTLLLYIVKLVYLERSTFKVFWSFHNQHACKVCAELQYWTFMEIWNCKEVNIWDLVDVLIWN